MYIVLFICVAVLLMVYFDSNMFTLKAELTVPLPNPQGQDAHQISGERKSHRNDTRTGVIEQQKANKKLTANTRAGTWIRKLAIPKCQFVYLDLGSNKGVQIRKLFEPELYPGAAILSFFDKFFGERKQRRKDVCAFGFEANPRHMARLKYIEAAYTKKGMFVKFHNQAVSNRDNDTVTIYSETDHDIDWGAGIIDNAIHDKENMTRYNVSTVDIAGYISSEIISFKPKKVFVKMDIEGSEFLVLPHLLQKQMLCRGVLTTMGIELHAWAREAMKSDLNMDILKQELKRQTCEPTELIEVDDESYNRDVNKVPA